MQSSRQRRANSYGQSYCESRKGGDDVTTPYTHETDREQTEWDIDHEQDSDAEDETEAQDTLS